MRIRQRPMKNAEKTFFGLEAGDGFLLVRFFAPNFILGRGARVGGEEPVGFFLVDFLVVFLAGMVWLLRGFWEKRGEC